MSFNGQLCLDSEHKSNVIQYMENIYMEGTPLSKSEKLLQIFVESLIQPLPILGIILAMNFQSDISFIRIIWVEKIGKKNIIFQFLFNKY